MKLNILKCHGSGNDFILIDEVAEGNEIIPEHSRADLSRLLCNRQTGIGADGILFYMPSDIADCQMRMFNPDGSEAEMCGNGLRCIGRYGAEKLMKNSVTVETMKSNLIVSSGKPIFEGIQTFEAEIGPISLTASSLPMLAESETFCNQSIPELSDQLTFTALTIPNPHIVTVVNQIKTDLVNQCGRIANNCSRFPNGVNVSFVQSLGINKIFVMTYERGVGITYSCGTAMSASSYVSVMNHITNPQEPIYIFNKGGMVCCDVPALTQKNHHVVLKGNATFVFETAIEVDEGFKTIEKQYDVKTNHDEINAYANLQNYAQSVIGGIV